VLPIDCREFGVCPNEMRELSDFADKRSSGLKSYVLHRRLIKIDLFFQITLDLSVHSILPFSSLKQ